MSLVSDFLQAICKFSWRSQPKHLVRLCRSRTEFIIIINEAINASNQEWDQKTIDNVIKYILRDEKSGISVYSSNTLDPLDHGHALAVVAESICQPDFRITRGEKRKLNCSRGTLLIPTSCLPKSTVYEYTPKNNLDFYPANNYHYDLTVNDTREFAIAILKGINQRTIAWSILSNEKQLVGSYRLQAAIAYSRCLQIFGKLNPNSPPSNWLDGETLDASQQIETLKYLAQTSIADSPTSLKN